VIVPRPVPRSRLLSDPAVRLSIFLSFVFAGSGAGLPFLPRWLEAERGLSGLEIGAVTSSAALARVFVAPLIAAWADGFADRRTPLRILPCAAALAYVLFWRAQGFPALFAAGFAASTLAAAVVPLAEGAILRASAAGGLPYGVGRAMASAAFVVGNVGAGLMIARFGTAVAIAWVIASQVAAAATASVLLPDGAPSTGAALGFRSRLALAVGLLRNPRFALAIVGCGLIQAGHAFYYNFSTLVWRRQGVDEAYSGVLWAIGVLVEIGFLAFLPAFERRVRPEWMILAGAAAGVVRWSALALSPPLAWVAPLQALHALTFAAAHVGALRIVQRETPDHAAGLGQTLYAALASGTFMGASAILSGALYDSVGAGGYWAMAALALTGGILITRMMRIDATTRQA